MYLDINIMSYLKEDVVIVLCYDLLLLYHVMIYYCSYLILILVS